MPVMCILQIVVVVQTPIDDPPLVDMSVTFFTERRKKTLFQAPM